MRKRIFRSSGPLGGGRRPRRIAAAQDGGASAARRSRAADAPPIGRREEGAGARQRPSALLAAAGVRPSKARGQNFLVQAAIANRIVASAQLTPEDEAIEIGPGLGILTDRILDQSLRRLSLIELDSRLAAQLKDRMRSVLNLEIVQADVLELDLATVIERPPVKILGNLPFNVAAAVLRKLADYRQLISRMVLMFQREVADRIRAQPGEAGYAALSAYTALDWEIERHFRVDAGSFYPRPKVDAEVLVFVPRALARYETAERQSVLDLIRAGFSSPRKIVRNNFSAALKLPAAQVEAVLDAAAIDPHARAETLSTDDFVRLARGFDRYPGTRA